MDDALELLGPGFTDRRVRAFAVARLRRADDEVGPLRLHAADLQEILLYLLQLVQALKFEHGHTSSTRSRRREEQQASDVGDSGLAQFLIERAVANPLFATKFHWYLGIECNFHTPFGKMFTEVGFRLQTKLGEVSGCKSCAC